MPQYKNLICPECNGEGLIETVEDTDPHRIKREQCYYCDGTGYATDEDSEVSMYSYEKDW